jgi:hypothetical protein
MKFYYLDTIFADPCQKVFVQRCVKFPPRREIRNRKRRIHAIQCGNR